MGSIVLLNGPPGCGKDTFADIINAATEYHTQVARMASPLKLGLHALLNLRHGEEAFNDVKEDNIPEFFGLTPREAYIMVSEQWLKPTFGQQIFGWLWLRKNMTLTENFDLIVPDCGFADEVIPLLQNLGPERIHLINIHRPECNFSNDSRSHISIDSLTSIGHHHVIINDSDLEEYEHTVLTWWRANIGFRENTVGARIS